MFGGWIAPQATLAPAGVAVSAYWVFFCTNTGTSDTTSAQ